MNQIETLRTRGNLLRPDSPPAPKKKRKPLRGVSQKRQGENRKYLKLREEFLRANPKCFAANIIRSWMAHNDRKGWREAPWGWLETTQIHHTQKPRCKYLNDTSTWLAVSPWAHRWIEDHKNIARELGLLS